MTLPETLKHLRELEAKATPGPWRQNGSTVFFDHPDYPNEWIGLRGTTNAVDSNDDSKDENGFTRSLKTIDARLIAETRNALPGLLDALERSGSQIPQCACGNPSPKGNICDGCKWKDEYDNLCKFATDYEQQRDKLRTQLAEAKEVLGKHCQYDYECVGDASEARALLKKWGGWSENKTADS